MYEYDYGLLFQQVVIHVKLQPKCQFNYPQKHTLHLPFVNMFLIRKRYKFQAEINNFRESFERGEDPLADMTDGNDINSVSGVLKLYLRELREPIFSVQYFDQFMLLASELK